MSLRELFFYKRLDPMAIRFFKETIMDKQNIDTRVEARWCVDSETGVDYLIDLKTNEILARRVDGEIIK